MSFFKSTDLFSNRFINAEIDDETDRRWVVHIKHVLGGYFLADLEGRLYAFKLGKTKTLKHTLTKKFEFLNYTTTNYKPIDSAKLKELELLCTQHSLPKIDRNMLDVLTLLAKREKNMKKGEIFKGHDIKKLIDQIMDNEDANPEKARNLKTFLDELDTAQLLTPVRRVSDFLHEELKETDTKYLADVSTQHQRTEIENRIMTNRPIKGGKSMMKVVLVIMVAGLVIGVGVYLLSSGQLSHGISIFPSTPAGGGGAVSSGVLHAADIASKYPTPESLVSAINSKTVSCTQLDGELKAMVNRATAGTCP